MHRFNFKNINLFDKKDGTTGHITTHRSWRNKLQYVSILEHEQIKRNVKVDRLHSVQGRFFTSPWRAFTYSCRNIMDEELAKHTLYASIKKLNRDYVTKETTGLLMKEIDGLRSPKHHHSKVLAAGGEASTSRQHADGSVIANGLGSRVAVPRAAAEHASESTNVARAILKAVKSARKEKSPSSHGIFSKRKSNAHPEVLSADNTPRHMPQNGHATEDEIQRLHDPSDGVLPGTSGTCPRAGRGSSRLHIDLRPNSVLAANRLKNSRQSGPRAKSLESATLHTTSATIEHATIGPLETQQKAASQQCEHDIIAFNSALLQVQPTSPTSPVESQTPNSGLTGSEPFETISLRVKRVVAEPISSAESSPRVASEPPPHRPHSTSSMHRGQSPSRPSDMITALHDRPSTSTGLPKHDSVSTNDDELASGQGTSGGCSVGTTCGIALPACCSACSPNTESFLQFRNRFCTSYRLKIPNLKNPVDTCVLPNDCLAVADYDNGYLILNAGGDVVKHHVPLSEGRNACGVCCSTQDQEFRLLILSYKNGTWSIQSYDCAFDLVDTIACPTDVGIETWALRKIVIAPLAGAPPQENDDSPPCGLYLMASGQSKTMIWGFDFGFRQWKMMISENSRRGAYNDVSIRHDARLKETHFLLTDWKKGQLAVVILNEALELVDHQTIKIKRVKGQEWIVQGPKLSAFDEHSDILVYDGSGKLFLFDGESHRCKKIVGDLGKGEISSLTVKDGWCYALCRYRLCVEAFLYKEVVETSL